MPRQHYSAHNAYLARRARRCTCEPYSDILTRARWLKQRLAPKDGARATAVRVLFPFPTSHVNGNRLRTKQALTVRTALLYCRCQVEPLQRPSRRKPGRQA